MLFAAIYLSLALVVLVLIAGMVNLLMRSGKQASRSNRLMRARILVQFVAVLILVAAGVVAGIV